MEVPTTISGASDGITVDALSVKNPNIRLFSGEQALSPVVCQLSDMDFSADYDAVSGDVRFLSILTTA